MELLNQTFTAQSVALATGCTSKQITDWCNLGRVVGQREPLGRGHSRKFSWFNLMEIAIAAELMNIGMSSVQDAFAASQKFAHSGESPSHWVGEEPIGPPRIPAMPWHHTLGQTLLFVYQGGSAVKLVDDGGKVNLSGITPEYHRFTGLIVANVSEIFMRVCNRMALDGRKVLDEAYSDAVEG
ncbi:hypothetical protein [Paenirhodobacter sp. CAU 1674]|uniref:hypothetical protein n=1 Tax=Paenirhodobacter sp. CAU 1674 TaxID=3032596 RepID=UPI0023DB1DB1|nr:hypothetical protein [Paenirhodobacter sp. CAU 1674]MDF2140814.1 hypothetical protein [Paenirhodobacter sp. CAU 1674]